MLAACADEDVLGPAGQLERIRAYLEPELARRYDAAAARIADLEQLRLLAQGYEARGTVPGRAHARPAGVHLGPGRTARRSTRTG